MRNLCTNIKRKNLISFLIFFYTSLLFSQSNSLKDSLLQQLYLREGVTRIPFLYQLYDHYSSSNPDSSYLFLSEGLSLAITSSENKEIILDGYNKLSDYWFNRGEYDSIVSINKIALEIGPIKNLSLKIWTYNNQGRALLMKSNYLESTKWFMKALELAQELKNDKGIQVLTNNLGNVYWTLRNLDKAEEYYQRALQLAMDKDYKHNIAMTLNNLGMIYKERGEINEALNAYNNAIAIVKNLNKNSSLSIYLQNKGELLFEQEKYEEAYDVFNESYKISKKIKDNTGMILSLINMGVISTNLNKFNRAEVALNNAFKIIHEKNYKIGYMQVHEAYAKLYERKGDYKKALNNLKLYQVWNDSVHNTKNIGKFYELQGKIEVQKRENDILKLEKEKLINEAEINKKNIFITFLTTLFSVAFLIFISFYFIQKERMKSKTQKELFSKVTDAKVSLQKKIAQYLHDNIGSMLILTKNQLQSIENASEIKEVEKSINTISKTIKEVRRISHDLMPRELIKFGLVTTIQSTILDAIDPNFLTTNMYAYKMKERIDIAIEEHLYRICQELIQNIIKHAKAKHLNIYLNRHKNYINLMIEDDGIGFNTITISNDKMGLKNVESRVRLLNGELKIDTNLNVGTTVYINVPI